MQPGELPSKFTISKLVILTCIDMKRVQIDMRDMKVAPVCSNDEKYSVMGNIQKYLTLALNGAIYQPASGTAESRILKRNKHL